MAGRKLTVTPQEFRPKLQIENPVDARCLFLSGFSETSSKGSIIRFMETIVNSSECPEVTFGEAGTAIIAYSNTIRDLDNVLTKIRRSLFEGQPITVAKVSMTDTILVKGFREGTDNDYIKYTFERRDVDVEVVIHVRKIPPSMALVSFHDMEDVERALSKTHYLGKLRLFIQPYYDCLGLPFVGQSTPKPFITEVSYSIMDFIFTTTRHKERLKYVMGTADAEVVWPYRKDNRKALINPRSSHISEDWTDWEIRSRQKFNEFRREYHRDIFKFPRGMGRSCKEWLKNLDKDVKATIHEEHNAVTISGVRSDVVKSKLQMERLAKESNAGSSPPIAKPISVTKELQPHEVQLLKHCGVKETMKEKHPNVQIRVVPEECSIHFHGSQSDINAARLDIRDVFDRLPHRKVEVHPTKIMVMLLVSGEEKISEILQVKNVHATFVQESSNSITIYGQSDEDVNNADRLLHDEILFESLPCTDNLLMVLRSQNGEQSLRRINEKYVLCLTSFDSESQCVNVAGFKDDFPCVKNELSQFMEDNSINEVSIEVPEEGKLQYLQQCLNGTKSEIKLPSGVQHHIGSDAITLRGKPNDVEKAQTLVSNFLSKIVQNYHVVSEPGSRNSDRGKSGKEQAFIRHVEIECNCKIDVIDSAGAGVAERSLPQPIPVPGKKQTKIKGRYHVSTGQEFLVCQGDITTEGVDGLVNAANTRLQHGGGVARAFVREGGEIIQRESDDIIRKRGRLSTSMVACTCPGNLSCKVILHVVGPEYQGGRHREDDQLYDAVTNVLKEADRRKLQSIALPAISSGIYKFPIMKCTETIVTAAFEYFTRSEDSNVTEVRFVDTDDAACRAFQDTLMHFGTEIVGGESDRDDSSGSSRSRYGSQEDEAEWPLDPAPRYPVITQDSSNTVRIPGGKTITIKQGNIATEMVDVIVNSVNVDVGLSHGKVSSAILSVAGKALQLECNSKLKLMGGRLRHWEFLKTGAANLSCAYVYHLSCGNYDGTGAGTTEHYFQAAIEELLHRADKDGMTSISLPAIGTGNLGFPPRDIARLMYGAALSFSQQRSNGSLKDIRFVIYEKDVNVIQAFHSEMQNLLTNKSTFNPVPRQFTGTSSTKTFDDFKVGADGVCRIKVGNIMVLLMNGSIVEAGTDCLVNSTNPDFGLKGPLSQAILKAGGKQIEIECEAMGGCDVLRKQLVVMTSAGTMQNTKKIIHVLIIQGEPDLQKKIGKALKMADQAKLRSIAFPAIGTGQASKQVSDAAEGLLNAIGTFAISNPKYLNMIKIAIYQPQFFMEYREAMKAVLGRGFNQRRGRFKEGVGRLKRHLRGSKSAKLKPDEAESWGSICFQIFADSEKNLHDAKDRLDDFIRDQFTTQELSYKADRIKLAEARKERLQEVARQKQTSLDFSMTEKHIRDKRIIVSGRKENILAVMTSLHNKLSEFQDDDNINKRVQWFYKDDTDDSADTLPYDEDINPSIERAYEQNKPYVDLDLEEGKVRIDFNTKEEFDPTNRNGPRVKVLRRDITEDDATRIPDNWDPNRHLEVKEMNRYDQKYQEVERKFHASFASTEQRHIVSIKEIRNPSLYQEYQLKKSHMLKTRIHIQVERDLYHGTLEDTCKMITKEGFNRSFHGKNATAYGKGTYFARDAKYSVRYADPDGNKQRHIFQCKVLTGEFYKGEGSMRAPPEKVTGYRYDSLVDSLQNPSIFVIFNDGHAYPEYLITFS
ncbi:LOW QUALITY PROTEIN: protein mono-ADP-ribosyltransferase PARP14-like [Amphiura filiformis]|uniref:LOW QUALITY PROTEIN: protein mono-ADP-ribosyltransferase PARP14-like n=1 Tax=Amphiura filiformis TaxID=82378 RepID=UPI003B20E02D